MSHSKPRAVARKPAARIRSPRKAALGLAPEFPLFPQGSGRWAKKIRGKLHYFGKVADDPRGEAALKLWLDQKDELLAGRIPNVHRGGLTVGALCSDYLKAKRRLLENNEISPRTWDDYRVTTDRIVAAFGKGRPVDNLAADDFEHLRSELAKTLGVVALSNAVQRVRSVFRYGYEAGQIQQPVRFGPGFKRPSKKSLRLARAAKGPRLFEAVGLRKIIDAADVQLKAMILLAINGGMGNSDIANLPTPALDLAGGWLNYPRPKTGVDRRIPLWPETVKALKVAIEERPAPKDKADAQLVFITKYGHNWGKLGRFHFDDTAAPTADEKTEGKAKRKSISSNNALSKEFRKLAEAAGVSRTFYDLRHSFATVGGGSLDQVAVNAIMGHADASMAATYRETIADSRLRAVAEHVRKWLYAPEAKKKTATTMKAVEAKAKRAKQEPEAATLRVVG